MNKDEIDFYIHIIFFPFFLQLKDVYKFSLRGMNVWNELLL